MKFFGFVLFYSFILVGCGSDNDARTQSLTDMKSVLLYQHVETDRFRLLACPYAVDLDISHDCSNVFFTPEGGEYYFSGIPKQPLLFAPSQEAVKGLLTVPIVVGGAVLSWVVLRKLLAKLNLHTTKKQLKGDVPEAKVADDVATSTSTQTVKQFEELTQKSYRELEDKLKGINKSYADKFNNKEKVARSTITSDALEQQETKAFDEILAVLKVDKQFMDKQFEIIEEAIKSSKVYQRLGFSNRLGQPKNPEKIFENFKKLYNKEIESMHKNYNQEGVLKFADADVAIKNLQDMNDDLIEGQEEFLANYMQLIERADVLNTIRANKRSFRKETASSAAQDLHNRAKEIVNINTSRASNVRDFLIAAVGGLLAGSYLPDKIPALDTRMFTEREWKKLFARDDSFKKPLRIDDSYAVVKKLTRYLKRKGEKVVINEQLFFGLKN